MAWRSDVILSAEKAEASCVTVHEIEAEMTAARR
jgi:hypothetical protein